MSKLKIYTFDWLPDFPRGYVRDMRARWAAEEVGRDYEVGTVPSHPKSDAHKAMQPFAQVPMIEDGELALFESGAIVLHLAEGTDLLAEAKRAEITQWVIAALNSVEPPVVNWMTSQLSKDMPDIFGPPPSAELEAHFRDLMDARLAAVDRQMADRDWIAGDFSAADIILADVLRQSGKATQGFPALTDYIARATARPAFQKAYDDHMAHWKAADAAKNAS